MKLRNNKEVRDSPSGLFLGLLAEAEQKEWCVRFFCTTCGARDFRTRLKNIGPTALIEDLRKTNPYEILKHQGWTDALRITEHDFGITMDWDSILQSWLSEIQRSESYEYITFLDYVLFHLLWHVPRQAETYKQWLDACVAAAISSRDPSLLESLIRVLGTDTATYPKLLETALEIHPTYSWLHDALAESGYLPSRHKIAKEKRESKMRLRATRNLRAAIRRRDINAIESMLRWKPDLDEKDEEGGSIADLARSSNDDRIRDVFENYSAT
jgi:hypothetical protein